MAPPMAPTRAVGAWEITKAQLLCLRLGQLKDEGKARPQQTPWPR